MSAGLPTGAFRNPHVDLSAADWSKLEQAAGVTFSAASREELNAAIREYRLCRAADAHMIRPKKVRQRLEKISKALTELSRDLESPERENVAALLHIRRTASKDFSASDLISEWKRFQDEIEKWGGRVTMAIRALPPDPGAPVANSYIKPLIAVALEAFHREGGQGKYTQPAMAFARAVCAIVGHHVHSDGSLEQLIKQLEKTSG